MNYSSLKTSIATWLNRSDLDSVVDDFIDLAEARLDRELRLQVMEVSFSETISSGKIAVWESPQRYIALKHAYLDTTPVVPLERVDANKIYQDYPNRSASGRPECIAREGEYFIFGPYPDSSYTVKGIYYTNVQRLGTGTNQALTNWFTDNAPELLLAACCVQGSIYLKDDNSTAKWEALYLKYKDELNRAETKEKFSGRGLSMRIS